jgi:hypothetical protein
LAIENEKFVYERKIRIPQINGCHPKWIDLITLREKLRKHGVLA